MKYSTLIILGIVLWSMDSLAGERSPVNDHWNRVNYSLGYQIGGDLKRQGRNLDTEALLMGLDNALTGIEPKLSSEDMNRILLALKKDIVTAQREDRKQERRKIKEAYRGEGREFLARNAEAEGVVTLPSGLQYKIDRVGTGKTPGPHDTVKVHYRGTLLDGSEFDSSYRKNQAAEFRVDGVIAGWTEALQLMKEGARWRIFVPADLAYGERGPLADQTVIFDVELLSVAKDEQK